METIFSSHIYIYIYIRVKENIDAKGVPPRLYPAYTGVYRAASCARATSVRDSAKISRSEYTELRRTANSRFSKVLPRF